MAFGPNKITWCARERAVWDTTGDDLSTVAWCERNVVFPPSVTEIYGPWRSSITPWATAIMNLWDVVAVGKVVKNWAPQTAKTSTTLLPVLRKLALGRRGGGASGPALFVMSSEAGVRRKFKRELIPILHASPGFRDMLSTAREDMTSSTVQFAGQNSRLDGAWVTSLPALKSFSYGITIGDEISDWPADVSGGGDPETLLDVRMRFRRNQRMELISSPAGEQGIWSKCLACEEVWVYLAHCPTCGADQRLVWPVKGSPFFPRWEFDSKAEPDRIEAERAAWYLCAACGAKWGDAERDLAIRSGGWHSVLKSELDPDNWDNPRPTVTRSAQPASIGTHLPSWCSGLVPLAKVVADFLRAEKTPDPVERVQKLKTWTNNHPAHPWIEARESAIDVSRFDALRDDRPSGTVPPWALVLILTADVQASGCFYELRAWDASRRSALVRYGFVAAEISGGFDWERYPPGFPRSGDFAALREVYLADYLETDGTQHRPVFGVVDSRYRGVEVTDFCRSMNHDPESAGRPVWPSLGFDQLRGGQLVKLQKVDTYPGTSKLIPGGLWRIDVDTTKLKDALYLRLGVTPGDPGSWLLHRDTGSDYVQHYRSESKDELTQRWVQRGRQPNHWWDCGVLQLAAANVLETQGLFGRLSAPRPAERQAVQRPQERHRLW